MRRRKEQEKICHVCHKIQSTKWRRVTEDALIKCKDTGIRLEVDNYLCNFYININININYSRF